MTFMKKIYKFVMIVLLFIMLIFSAMSIYLAENSDIDSIKAEGSSTKLAKKNLLDPSKWQVSYSYRGIDMNGSSTSTDPLNNKFNLSTYLTKSPVDINSWGTGQVTSTNGLYFYVDVPDERDKNKLPMDKRIGTRQKVSFKSGRYYQYKFRVFLSHGDKLYPYSELTP